MALSRAARELRKRPCTCGKDRTHYGPHTADCPRFVDRSKSKRIREALIERRHNERQGEWLNIAEFRQIDLFAFHLWGEWPDAKRSARTGLERGARYHRRVSYEIKTSRSDFLREIKRPQKRAFAVGISHQYFFATPPGLVRKQEIPEECGLIEVDDDGKVRVVKHAPIRKPTASLTTSDVVALLRAKHLGPSVYEIRDKAERATKLLAASEREYVRAQALLQMARVRLIREKGHLLEAGSEWIGMWPPHGQKQTETRVVVTSVGVDQRYEDERDRLMNAHNGTVYAKPVAKVEADGHHFMSDWMDPGDFLIAFRHVAEPARVKPPERSHFPRGRPKLAVLDGERDGDDIVS